MNKLICGMACCGLMGVAMAVETAFEGQSIGTMELNPGTKSTMVAVSFNELSPTDGAEITAANLVSTKNLAEGDAIYVYRNGGYAGWSVTEDAAGTKIWSPMTKVAADATGAETVTAGVDPQTVGLTIGSGFWLVRGDASRPFYLYGAYVASVGAVAAKAQPGTKTLLGNPTSSDCGIVPVNPTVGDSIGLVAGDGKLLRLCTWGTVSGVSGWCQDAGSPPRPKIVSVSLHKGEGFWYNSTGSEEVSFNW